MTTSVLTPVTARSLATSIIDASAIPLLLLNEKFVVVAASPSFGDAFDIAAADVAGHALATIGGGEWGGARLLSLLEATLRGGATIDAYEMDLKRPGKPDCVLILNAQLLDHGDTSDVRLLLAITDVTAAREKERLEKSRLEENQVLLQELQHRVANSLQIIASVLMQSARRVQSDETRGHLQAAHHRVLSVAAVQSHLAASRTGDVRLRAYITDLCTSISASMIHDPAQLSLDVEVDDSSCSPDTSMSLGLIITELVINALKHAFPEHRHGKIIVRYAADGAEWILSVGDDGVGMPALEAKTTGLGTSIVDALARKLKAHVVTCSTEHGTSVSISH